MGKIKKFINSKVFFVTLNLLIVFLLGIVPNINTTGSWYTSTDGSTLADQTFGSIELGEIGASPITINKSEGDVVMPGDTVDVDFDVLNNGTADMWVRFQIKLYDASDDSEILTTDGDYIFEEDLEDLNTDVSLDSSWVFNGNSTAGGDYYYKNIVVANGDAKEDVIFTLTISDAVGDGLEDTSFYITLDVEAIQVANNGHGADGQTDTADDDYTAASWTGSFEPI